MPNEIKSEESVETDAIRANTEAVRENTVALRKLELKLETLLNLYQPGPQPSVACTAPGTLTPSGDGCTVQTVPCVQTDPAVCTGTGTGIRSRGGYGC